MSQWKCCERCFKPGYFSLKFKMVLCDACYFAANGASLWSI